MQKLLLASVTSLLTVFLVFPLMVTSTASAQAPTKDGTFLWSLNGEPTSLHPISSTDLYSREIQAYVLDSLAYRDNSTYEWKPALAERWEIAPDKMSFTFYLRKGAVFHDGKPVTAEDVKFSYDAVFIDDYQAAHLRPYFENISKVEVIDPLTIKFTAKNSYFNNFSVVAGWSVIPKHVYGDVQKSKKMTRTLVGSGPYKLEKYEQGRRLVLKRFDNFYGLELADNKERFNFDRIIARFQKDSTVRLEMLKKGDIDFTEMSPEDFMLKAKGAEWGKKVLKKKVENLSPKSTGFIGWNLKNPKFKDKEVRQALAHLMNREEMNKKFRFGLSEYAAGPVYVQSDYADPSVKPFLFDVKKAVALLKKAGFEDRDKNGVLEKKMGKETIEMRFSVLFANKDSEKYLTIYKEDLKKAGIEMEIKLVEWNSFLRLTEEGNFDAILMSWGGGSVDWDPKQIWHSSSAVKGGSNFIGYKNAQVDKWIDEARLLSDKEARKKILKNVYKTIADEAPYAFLFNDKYQFYGHTSRMKMKQDTFKYAVGTDFWWSLKAL